jgi:hypothetical protein
VFDSRPVDGYDNDVSRVLFFNSRKQMLEIVP